MNAHSEAHFKHFRTLLDKVVAKSGISKSFAQFGNREYQYLSRKIGLSRPGDSHISSSTLRDYKYIYQQRANYPFRPNERKLDILSEFLGYNSWADYLKKEGAALQKNEVAMVSHEPRKDKQVVVCFGSKDLAWVNTLKKDLESYGINVWVYEDQMITGANTISTISDKIMGANLVLAVISKNSITSRWVQRELSWAIGQEIKLERIKVLPLVIDNVTMPPFLSEKRYTDFTKDYQGSLKKLARHISALQQNKKVEEDLTGENIIVKRDPTTLGLKFVGGVLSILVLSLLYLSYGIEPQNKDLQTAFDQGKQILVFALIFVVAQTLSLVLQKMQRRRDVVFANDMAQLHVPFVFSRPYLRVMRYHYKKPMVMMILFIDAVLAAGMLIVIFYFILWASQVIPLFLD